MKIHSLCKSCFNHNAAGCPGMPIKDAPREFCWISVECYRRDTYRRTAYWQE